MGTILRTLLTTLHVGSMSLLPEILTIFHIKRSFDLPRSLPCRVSFQSLVQKAMKKDASALSAILLQKVHRLATLDPLSLCLSST